MTYASLILPVPLDQTFTYVIPPHLEAMAQVGQRALVPFGRNHVYTGIIVSLSPLQPQVSYELRPIQQILPGGPVIRHFQYPFWQWLAYYYMCPIGDVMKAALPSLLKPEEGSQGTIRENFKPKTQTMVHIVMQDDLKAAFDSLQRSPQQMKLYMRLLDMSHAMQKGQGDAVARTELLKAAGTNPSILNELLRKGLVTTTEEPISRLDPLSAPQPELAATPLPAEALSPLTQAQSAARSDIVSQLRLHQVCLLHGVTSSGKTEVYIHLIHDVIAQGRQVLMMVPEIALTTQLCQRLRRVFGRQMLVYHSKLSEQERVEIWQTLLQDRHSPGDSSVGLILGVRSAIFLPYQQLGLIIVDEEHEPTYKQQDPAPRYHGRDAAMVLAQRHGAKVLLGSATPSLESYWLAQQGRYGLVSLTERYAGVSLPRITLAPFSTIRNNAAQQDAANDDGPALFTPLLLQRLTHLQSQGQQAILFQNRRGYAQQIECVQCGWMPRCPRCDVTLTYHKRARQLECHYCGYHQPWAWRCPKCGNTRLEQQGSGTERIEEQLHQRIPALRILRMDTDTTSTRQKYEHIIHSFEQHQADVLIGTQMVAKGLDFDAVATVGILNADTLMNFPDFRSHERAFQLMEQVAGRAGRREGQEGEVIIQCRDPHNPLLIQVVHHDYMQMAATQLHDRQQYHYPPYTRLIMIYLKGRYEDRLEALVGDYAAQLRYSFGDRILGPEAPLVSRVRNMFIRRIMLKVERDANIHEVRRLLTLIQQQLQQNVQEFARIVFYYDVDPVG